jgi:hypothetical protein
MQQVDGLPWLACPWSPSSWYSNTSPSSAQSSFDSIAGKTTNTHPISIHAYMDHTQDMHHTTQALSIRNKHVQIFEPISILHKSKLP